MADSPPGAVVDSFEIGSSNTGNIKPASGSGPFSAKWHTVEACAARKQTLQAAKVRATELGLGVIYMAGCEWEIIDESYTFFVIQQSQDLQLKYIPAFRRSPHTALGCLHNLVTIRVVVLTWGQHSVKPTVTKSQQLVHTCAPLLTHCIQDLYTPPQPWRGCFEHFQNPKTLYYLQLEAHCVLTLLKTLQGPTKIIQAGRFFF